MFDGDEQPRDLIAMGGEAATQTMTNRHLKHIDLRQKPLERLIMESHELRQKPHSRLQSDNSLLSEVHSKEPEEPRVW